MGLLIVSLPAALLVADLGSIPGVYVRLASLSAARDIWLQLAQPLRVALLRQGIGAPGLTHRLREAYRAGRRRERLIGNAPPEKARRQPGKKLEG